MLKKVVRIMAAVVLLVCGFSAAAQTMAQFSGRVTDPQGAIIQGAEVRVVNQATGIERRMVTNNEGLYTVPFLNPGMYQIFVQANGFTTTSSESITINVGQSLSFDVQLRLMTTQQQVDVAASVPMIDQTSSSLGTIETAQRIVDLPLNGRNFLQLAYLGAGANQGAQNNGALRGTTDNNRPGIQVAVNGLTSFDNNFLLDGVDNNEFGQGTLVIQPAPDAIQEFRVEENSMRAEFGRGGAAVNVLLKSGTNKFHGGVYEFIRNDKLDARNYFDPQRPPFQRNQFGALLGGPIIRNRTFFFADYEGERIRQGVSYVSSVPTTLMHTGDFSELKTNLYDPQTTNSVTSQRALLNPGNPFVIPANRIDSVGQAVLNVLPLPNLPGTVNNFVYTPKQVTNGDQFDVRIDHNIRQTDQLFGHAALQDVRFLKPAPLGDAGGCCQGFGSNIDGREQSYAVGEYHAFSKNITNDAHFAFLRWQINTQHLDEGQDRSQQLGIPNANRVGNPYSSGLSLFNLSGYTSFGDSSYVPEIATDDTYQIADIVTWLKGRHAFKFGGDFRYLSRDFFQSEAPFGTFSFSGQYTQNIATGDGGSAIADLLLGIPVSKLQDNLASMDKTNMREFDTFFQDDWKIVPGLTLNLGFRYDLYSPVGGRVGNFNLQTAIVDNNYGPNAIPNAGVAYDKADLGPRVGFAYSPQSQGGMVVHGAFGIFYSPEGNIFNDLGENPPLLELYSAAYSPAQIPQTTQLLRSGFPATLPAIDPLHPTGQVKTTGTKRLIPRIMEWNLGLEKELPGSWVMSLAYVGTQGQRLWDNEASDLNQAHVPLDSNFGPAPNYGRPYFNVDPDLSDILTIDYPRFNLHFNALETKLQKNVSKSLTMLASYTWSKDIGTSHGTPGTSVQDSYNTNGERGYVEPDFRHRFTISYTYQLPFGSGRRFGSNMGREADLMFGGWELSGITVARTGEHETANTSNDYTNTGSFGPRPDQLSNPADLSFDLTDQARLGCTPGKKTLACWYNPAAFAIPALAPGQTFAHNFGNSYAGSIVGPSQLNFDVALMKSFRIVEEQQLAFRTEMFNVENHAQFQIPNSTPDVLGGASISSTLPDNQREVQFSLKYMF
jgi:hypothetical protein